MFGNYVVGNKDKQEKKDGKDWRLSGCSGGIWTGCEGKRKGWGGEMAATRVCEGRGNICSDRVEEGD